MLDRLMGGAVLAHADGVVGHHEHHPQPHQGGQADRGAAVVAEHHEGAAIGNDAAMQGHAVHRRGHAMLADAVAHIASGEIARRDVLEILGAGVVRGRQVGAAADGVAELGVDDLQRLLAHLAGAGVGFFGRQLFLQRRHGGGEPGRNDIVDGVVKFPRLGAGGLALFPGGICARPRRADGAPLVQKVVGHHEGLIIPVQRLARARDLLGSRRVAVRLLGTGAGGETEADDGAAGDHHRRVGGLRLFQGAGDVGGVMAVAGVHDPARRLEAFRLIGGVRQADIAVDGDVVVVPQHDQILELQVSGQADGFLADAFHQVAVAGDDIGLVVDQAVAEAGVEDALGQRETHRIGDTLAQRAGGGLDARQVAMLGMAGGGAADLAELLEILDGNLGIAGQPEQGIEQHRAVPGRQDEAVAVGPAGVARVEFQKAGKQHRGDIGHAQRQARMARFGGLHRVHGQETDGVGEAAGLSLIGGGHGCLSRKVGGGLSGGVSPPSRALDQGGTRTAWPLFNPWRGSERRRPPISGKRRRRALK